MPIPVVPLGCSSYASHGTDTTDLIGLTIIQSPALAAASLFGPYEKLIIIVEVIVPRT
ncbi:MAG TPA: hypothetical protein VGZ48_00570 [Candidatus Acidoferrales bacterium]|nr:hypothetical protein [Candidatus Acidoferrales bacterium]